MDKRRYRRRTWVTAVLALLLFGGVLAFALTGIRDAVGTADAEGLRIAEESIRRAVLVCYATEGVYPDSYEYLRDHYGLRVDEEKYIIHYEVFASNLMPDITVMERRDEA